jgi:parvulin-like peptidyl-prolyl isomerase
VAPVPDQAPAETVNKPARTSSKPAAKGSSKPATKPGATSATATGSSPAPRPAAPATVPVETKAKPIEPADPATEPIALPPLSSPEPPPGDPGPADPNSKPAPTPTPTPTPGGEPQAAPRAAQPQAQNPPPAAPDAPRDPEVKTATVDPTAVRSNVPPRSVFEAGQIAAWVGDEVITLQEWIAAVNERRKGHPGQMSKEESYYLARAVLNEMVSRALVVQEAKHEAKNPKQFQQIVDQADKVWTDEEVPPLLRRYASPNVHELKRKMAEKNESYEELRESFRKTFIYQGFLMHKLGSKLSVTLPEMIAYYNEHLKEFDRPAQVAWREVLVEVGRNGDRAAARRKADAVLDRLRRGEDFAAVAKAESDGPNKRAGGLWETSPGSYGVDAVNAALGTLRVGELSGVLEGPSSFHVVRVESRRAAGPATFAEVQDKIKEAIHDRKVKTESEAYLEKLRARTIVSTVLDEKPANSNSGVTRASAVLAAPPARRTGP